MTLSEKECASIIFLLLSKKLKTKPSNIKSNDKLIDLGLDSLSFVEVIMELEEQLNININDKQLSKIKTVNDIIKFLYNLKIEKNKVYKLISKI